MEDMAATIGIIILIVIVFFYICAYLVKSKRNMHNAFRALKEVRSIDDIEIEEDAMRSANSIMGQYEKKEKKKGGGFFKGVVVTVIVVVALCFILGVL